MPTPSFEIQMIKGVRIGGMKTALSYLDTLEVPIIENTPNEEDLKDSMADAMRQYPDAAAVLVRRHGIYVWGTPRSRSIAKKRSSYARAVQEAIGKRQRRRRRYAHVSQGSITDGR
jgi:ribulose-5-phosphate 4-epimerase/fuculose-1-phosphate aldolase